MSVTLTFYDGANCIGGNKILLEADGTSVLLDFGMNFVAQAQFFDTFLQPRATMGLGDLLVLGLLPPLRGIYRSDYELPQKGWWKKLEKHPLYRELKVDGLLLSHAHLDHTGYISFLSPDIPIYSSTTTAYIAKAMQDSSKTGFDRDVAYITLREEKKVGLLDATQYKKVPHKQRQYFLFQKDGTKTEEQFWAMPGGSRQLDTLRFQSWQSSGANLGALNVRCWPVDHSIPGASAFGIQTTAGWIIYTGDLRLHGNRSHETRAFMQEAGQLNPLALICEGTHPRTDTPTSEQEVFNNILPVIRSAQGLVIADFGPRNIDRLMSFLLAADQAGRKLALTAKDAYLLEALYQAGEEGICSPVADSRIVLYKELKSQPETWEKNLLRKWEEECPERIVNASTLVQSPDRYVLCISYFDLHEMLDTHTENGVYIYSSSSVYDDEMDRDMDRLRAWVQYFGFQFVGDPGDKNGNSREHGFHASGHIHGAGLEELVETIRPKVLIPVHTTDSDFFGRFEKACQVIIPSQGDVVKLGVET